MSRTEFKAPVRNTRVAGSQRNRREENGGKCAQKSKPYRGPRGKTRVSTLKSYKIPELTVHER